MKVTARIPAPAKIASKPGVEVAKTLKVYTVQSKSSLRAQSQVVEEALIEFFERHNVKIEE